MPSSYCLAHGLITLHVRTEAAEQTLPATLYEHFSGEEALRYAGPRVQRVARWDAAGWTTWWALLARLAAGRPVVAAIPPLEGEIPPDLPAAHVIPPSLAVRAASALPTGLALYLGAFGGEAARFDLGGVEEPQAFSPGLEALYRVVVAEVFRRERRAILPVQVPALLQGGPPPDVAGLLEGILPHLDGRPIALGGEDEAVVAAVAAALRAKGHEVLVVDPLSGMERLVWAIGGQP